MAILKIVGVTAPKTAKTGNGTFKTVKFAEFNERCGILMPTGISAVRNLWSDRLNSEGAVIKGDRLYTMIDEMQYLDDADIHVVKSSAPYVDRNGATRDRTMVVCFKGEDMYSQANREFSEHGVCAIDNDGVIKGDLKATVERKEQRSERSAKLQALLVSKGLVKAEPTQEQPAKAEEPVAPEASVPAGQA